MDMYDVTIAGGGPVGLLLAIELRHLGVEVLVIERRTVLDDPVMRGAMGGRAINMPSGRILQRLGLLDEIRRRALWWIDPSLLRPNDMDVQSATKGKPPIAGFIGHFSGLGLKASNLDVGALGDPGYGAGAVAMADIVEVLEAEAIRLGAEIRLGDAVTGARQDADGVTVETCNETFRTRWLVGCDGGRSLVRKAAGIGFPGTDAEFVGRVALVDFAPGTAPAVGEWIETPHGSWLHAPAGRIHVVEYGATIADRTAPVTAEEVEQSFARVSGLDATIERVTAAARYSDAARQADSYRAGRIILAGDAAHIHSPAGGQGLNQGFGDAVCLAPLLAAVVAGSAPPESLDTYDAKRRPVGARILDWTRAQSALGRPDPATRALRRVVADLLDSPASTTYVLKRLGGELGEEHAG
jgi:2-polyprenyl-6-methoxyphenol hydroxylase-like FAD-dependent oxidoreductase